MTIDLRGALRRRKPDKRLSRLPTRSKPASPDWTASESDAGGILIDTGVYIHQANGRLPEAVRDFVDRNVLFHCSVALAELAVGVANADPTRSGWTVRRDHYIDLLETVPDSRVLTPDAQCWLDAGLVAGTLTRVQGYQPDQRQACLNDTLIFLTAARAGLSVLTSNRSDFDLIQQLAPEGRFLHYEIDAPP